MEFTGNICWGTIYREVKEIKIRYKQQKDKIQAKIDALNKAKEKI